MSQIIRMSLMLVLATLVAAVVDSQIGFAQRISFGGSNQNDDDDDDDDENQNSQGGRRSSQSGNPNIQQFQQFFQGGQGGQGQSGQGQGGPIQFRRSGQQGQLIQGQQQGSQGGLKIGTWQAGKWQGSHKIENWMQTFGGSQQPFSSQWYQDHPKAWKYDNNKANIWVVATLPGVYSWLGWGNVPPQYNVGYGNVQPFDPSYYGDWYPLGVYSLMAGPGDMGTRIVQLAVDRHGHVAGNYYDMITNSAYNVSGDVKRQSQRVYWSLNKNQFVRFRAHISQLLQPYGMVTVQLPGGEQQWQFVRLEN
jgi:hypothetical protein